MKKHFTIGMAGHIDHGKTTLTKKLTNVDTDRLKEEKERQISIEPGFAPLFEDDHVFISIIDVPGHERFIRQMIAGVAGIDLVVLVVAADEGVMPQTKEHLDILQFLGIKRGIVAITKIDMVDEDLREMATEEIKEELIGTLFENSPILHVDSISGKGIEDLRKAIFSSLEDVNSRDIKGAFRLPIDQVFTVKGQGTVVRGTVYEGIINVGEDLLILPEKIPTKNRQMQSFHKQVNQAFAGQRVAINLSGINKDDIKRGDVLVSSNAFTVTKTIDVALQTAMNLDYLVKQRMPIKCHIGTSEVMGKIVFFDRNQLDEENHEVLCQLRLDEEVVVKRGDRFILRRPTPQETIGGGWVIDPAGDKYKFGNKTIEILEKKKEGKPTDRILSVLEEYKAVSLQDMEKRTSIEMEQLKRLLTEREEFLSIGSELFTSDTVLTMAGDDIKKILQKYHLDHPMRPGINKAELIQGLLSIYPKELLEYAISYEESKGHIRKTNRYYAIAHFETHVPKNWNKRVSHVISMLEKDGLQVKYLTNYYDAAGIPANMQDEITRYLLDKRTIIQITDQFFIYEAHYQQAIHNLKEHTEKQFDVGKAKEVLGLSRKHLIPLLEALDTAGVTKRDGNFRIWQ